MVHLLDKALARHSLRCAHDNPTFALPRTSSFGRPTFIIPRFLICKFLLLQIFLLSPIQFFRKMTKILTLMVIIRVIFPFWAFDLILLNFP